MFFSLYNGELALKGANVPLLSTPLILTALKTSSESQFENTTHTHTITSLLFEL
jgi:hypothetical protein